MVNATTESPLDVWRLDALTMQFNPLMSGIKVGPLQGESIQAASMQLLSKSLAS